MELILNPGKVFEVTFLRVSHSLLLRYIVGSLSMRTRVCNIPFSEAALREWNTVNLY